MKTKTLFFISLIFSSSIAFAEMPGSGMAGDMVKDAATDAVKEKVTDTAKDMVKGTVSPKTASEPAKAEDGTTSAETPKTEAEPASPESAIKLPK
jgi:hypothetical protein